LHQSPLEVCRECTIVNGTEGILNSSFDGFEENRALDVFIVGGPAEAPPQDIGVGVGDYGSCLRASTVDTEE